MGTMAEAALRSTLPQRLVFNGLPIAAVLVFVLLAWYAGAWGMNAPGAIERVMNNFEPAGAWTAFDLFKATMQMERPLLPAPHQVALDLWSSLFDWPVSSPRNLLFHAYITAQSTLAGFVMGTALGLVLSVLDLLTLPVKPAVGYRPALACSALAKLASYCDLADW